MRKTIKIDGKTYIMKDENPKEEESVEEEENVEEESKEDEEEFDEEAIDEVATKISKKLGLDKIEGLVKRIEQASKPIVVGNSKSAILGVNKAVQKDVSEMTSREKIIGFVQGMIKNDTAQLKALSEGEHSNALYKFGEFREQPKWSILSQVAT